MHPDEPQGHQRNYIESILTLNQGDVVHCDDKQVLVDMFLRMYADKDKFGVI